MNSFLSFLSFSHRVSSQTHQNQNVAYTFSSVFAVLTKHNSFSFNSNKKNSINFFFCSKRSTWLYHVYVHLLQTSDPISSNPSPLPSSLSTVRSPPTQPPLSQSKPPSLLPPTTPILPHAPSPHLPLNFSHSSAPWP